MKKNIIILFLLSFAVTAKNLVPEDYWNIQKVANPQVNSSGNVVAFLKTYIDKKNDKFESEIWVMNSDGSNKSFFAKGSNFKWSNKGNTLAYLKEDENEINQIFIKSKGKLFPGQNPKTQKTNYQKFSQNSKLKHVGTLGRITGSPSYVSSRDSKKGIGTKDLSRRCQRAHEELTLEPLPWIYLRLHKCARTGPTLPPLKTGPIYHFLLESSVLRIPHDLS